LLVSSPPEPGQFRQRDVARLQELADRAAPPLEQARLGEVERARSARARFLGEAAEVLSGQDSQQQIVALTARLVVPQLADWCALMLPGPRGGLHPAYLVHADESRADALAWLLQRARPAAETAGCAECGGGGIAGSDLAGSGITGSGITGSDITGSCAACQQGPVPWTRRPGLRWRLDAGLPGAHWPDTPPPPGAAELAQDGAWCFPLVAGGHRLGLLVVGGVAGGRLPAEAAELAESLSRRAAMALDNSRRQARHRLPSRAPQPPSLPGLPTIPGVQLAAAHEQPGGGAEPGCGFHDVFPAGQGRWRFVLADVCGTGPEAAAVSGLTRHALRILAREGYGIAAVLQRLNGLILEEGDQARFVTLVHGEITTGSPARVELACAGHPQPLVLRAAGGPAEPAAEVQPLLGVIGGQTFVTSDLPLMAGDLLLTVTDGVTKRRDGYRLLDDAGGLAAIFAASRGQPAGEVAASIATAAREFGSAPLADDLALLVIAAAG
jgi:serine phosphatase RsbU (regulator of sigma subunit)